MPWYVWVFSGVGVAVPLALLSWLIGRRRVSRLTKIRQVQEGGDSSTNVQIGNYRESDSHGSRPEDGRK